MRRVLFFVLVIILVVLIALLATITALALRKQPRRRMQDDTTGGMDMNIDEMLEGVRSQIDRHVAPDAAEKLKTEVLPIIFADPEFKERVQELSANDDSHAPSHIVRIVGLSAQIGRTVPEADPLVYVPAAILCDVGRVLEDRGGEDHAEYGAKLARKIFAGTAMGERAEDIADAVIAHRKTTGKPAKIDGKILFDADHLDILGAIAVLRTTASSTQSRQYERPLYRTTDLGKELPSKNSSALGYLRHLLATLPDEHFYTEKGKEIATRRRDFLRQFVDELMSELY